MLRRLVEAGSESRVLGVNTSNIDFGVIHAWDLVAEARSARSQRAIGTVFPLILLASSAVRAFPPREIDGSLFVDGAVTGNILYGGDIQAEEALIRSGRAPIRVFRCRR